MDPISTKNGSVHTPESPVGPVWKPDLYRLQQEAPKPHAIPCSLVMSLKPHYYGCEFHGAMNQAQASKLLEYDDSGESKALQALLRWEALRGDKRFDSLDDLVADGLVTMHIEAEAGSYIHLMSDVAKYEKSPAYMTLNRLKQRTKPIKEETVTYDKPHNFRTHNFKGLNWCEFCSNFLWGFTAQGVKCEDCGFSAHFKCSEKLPADCWPELKQIRSVFGVDLTTLVRAHRTVRPFVVDKCVTEIESRGLDAEGLYRVSGFADEMDALRMALDKDGNNADISATVYDNINVVAGILKLYFRLLPIPLVTYEVHPALVEAVHLPSLSEQMKGTKEALAQLPPAHYNTLKFLMAHLHRVEQCQAVNKMSAQNLGTVFAPTLMPTPNTKISGAIPDMSGGNKFSLPTYSAS